MKEAPAGGAEFETELFRQLEQGQASSPSIQTTPTSKSMVADDEPRPVRKKSSLELESTSEKVRGLPKFRTART